MLQSNLGFIGLGIMGQNLARNTASRGYHISVFNRTRGKTHKFIKKFGTRNLSGFEDLKKFVASLEQPRKIMLMVKAGSPVDQLIDELTPLLEAGDIIIDGGNSFFKDTIRREHSLNGKGIHLVGTGISGGMEGALHGPSIMPGGSDYAWSKIKPIFKAIAAKDFFGGRCVTHIGSDGAGHFVKIVHNGIEYGLMQLMAEVYDIYYRLYNISAAEIADIFEEYNKGRLSSFLIEIAAPVLRKIDDETGKSLVDLILDTAGQKGTGRWSVIEALELGIPVPTITAATVARIVSVQRNERVELAKKYVYPSVLASNKLPLQDAKTTLESALYAGMLTCYAEGFEMMKKAAKEYGWNLNYSEIARIWQGGCIIRSHALKILHEEYSKTDIKSSHLFNFEPIKKILTEAQSPWQFASRIASQAGIPAPALHASLNYFSGITSERLPANFIQAMRDYFGAHTYERTDKDGIFHTEWLSE